MHSAERRLSQICYLSARSRQNQSARAIMNRGFSPTPGVCMRLVYTADLHGDIDAYRSLLDFAVARGARAAIVGGDLLPHAIRLEGAIGVQRDFITGRLRPLLEDFRASHPEIAVYLLAGNDDWAAAVAALDDLERDGLAFPLHERVYRLMPVDDRATG